MLSNLMDFATHIGRKIFDTDAEAADNILKHIQTNNPGVDTLRVAFDDGVVTLTGRAKDEICKEKVVLMAGNVKGVERVDAEGISVIEPIRQEPSPASADPSQSAETRSGAAPASDASAGTQFYIIQSGDTLSGIAKQFYGNAMKYPQLFEANREVIEDPDKIYPGQKIRVPVLD